MPVSPTTRTRRRVTRRPTATARPTRPKAAAAAVVEPVAADTAAAPVDPTLPVFARPMFDALLLFPTLLERTRHTVPVLIPTNVIWHITLVRNLLGPFREWANEHPGEDVAVSHELWEVIKDWPALLERIRVTPRIPFAQTEVDAIVRTRTLWPVVPVAADGEGAAA